MADLNKVFLIGRLVQDPELRYTPNGAAVSDLRVVTSRTWTSKDGEKREDTLFIDVTVWNRQAEACCQYLKKGKQVHIEGYLKLENWESNTGEKRSKIKVEGERVQFLDRLHDSSGSSSESSDDEYATSRRAASSSEGRGPGNGPSRGPAASAPPARPRPADPQAAEDEDIPF
jgi:single-strand DNA-binding protein